MRILLTGFEPFGDFPSNPSAELIQALAVRLAGSQDVKTAILPVDTGRIGEALETALREFQPQWVIAFGLAAGRSALSLERVAVNLLDFAIPDNRGVRCQEQATLAGSPAAYFSTLPLRSMREDLQEQGIPAEISYSAGTYLCNQVFYLLMHQAQAFGLAHAGFVHLPATPDLAAHLNKPMPSMSLETMVHGLGAILSTLR